jgi:hypothetical protein
MSVPLELNCLVLGDHFSRIFPVKIANTESVGALKKAIKERRSVHLKTLMPTLSMSSMFPFPWTLALTIS